MAMMTLRMFRNLLNEAFLNEGPPKPPVGKEMAIKIAAKYPKGLQKLGIDPKGLSGLQAWTGTRGTAFDLGNGKVLKITNDSKEAQAANIISGKELKNVVRFYAVWQFKDTAFYGILQEKLEPLSKEEADAFNDAIVATHLPVWINKSGYDFEKSKEMVKQFIIKNLKKKFPDNNNSPEAQAYVRNVNTQWNLLVKKYGMRELFNTLKALGIDFHDFHAGNMMRRSDGTLVLIDLGNSKIHGGGNIESISQATNVAQ